MNIHYKYFLSVLFFTLPFASFASDDDDNYRLSSVCTQAVVERVDSPSLVNQSVSTDPKVVYGTGFGTVVIDGQSVKSSELTECIKVRDNVRALVAWNSDALNGNTGSGQQVVNARNLMNDWEASYAMTVNENYNITIVAYGKGAGWVKNDPVNNPAYKMVNDLLERGAKIYMCQNTMKSKKWIASDLIPGVRMVPSGVTALVDFQLQGLTYITP